MSPPKSVCYWGVCHAAQCVELLLGTPMCVQLDLQDVFIREAIPSCTTHTHTYTHRYLQAIALTARGYVVNATCVTVQCVWYAERGLVSAQQRGLSYKLCLSSALWRPDSYAISSLLVSLSKVLFRNPGVWSTPPNLRGTTTHSFPQAAGGGRGLKLALGFVYLQKLSGCFPPGGKNK